MAGLLDLPEEVVEKSILRYLSWNDLLRCRRVCRAIKYIADDFIRIRIDPKIAPEIEISETNTERSLEEFLSINIPISKLFLNNPSGHVFYDKLDSSTLTKFVEVLGPTIRSLRVIQLSLYPCFNEWTFLESLSSVQFFKARHIGLGLNPSDEELGGSGKIVKQKLEHAKKDPRFNDQLFPPNFYRTVVNLQICNGHGNMNYRINNIHVRLPTILEEIKNLQYISFPVHLNYTNYLVNGRREEFSEASTVLIAMFMQFYSFILKQSCEGSRSLNFVDFLNCHREIDVDVYLANRRASPSFLALCKICFQSGVFLQNVNPIWLSERLSLEDEVLKSVEIGNTILSLVNLHPCVVPLKMQDLQEINICSTSYSARVFAGHELQRQRQLWPSLKFLSVKVDSKPEDPPTHLNMLYAFLFKDILRQQLTELNILFESKHEVKAPKVEHIVQSCPNIKILQISNWPGTNKALTKLWIGLPALEQVALENCKELGNVAFVGDDVANPVFLSLKKLRKLTLNGLDQMPKITDTLFSLIISKMKLTHLTLTSEKPLIKVTSAGISTLLEEGPFAEFIEKFPFHGWSMENVSDHEFMRLGRQFRSSQMI